MIKKCGTYTYTFNNWRQGKIKKGTISLTRPLATCV